MFLFAHSLDLRTSVKRVVVTSSTSSIVSPKTGPYVFTESDWNDSSPAIVEREGKNAPPDEMYSASKTLAEKAAWEFMLTHQDEIAKKWDLVTLLPPYVFGVRTLTLPCRPYEVVDLGILAYHPSNYA